MSPTISELLDRLRGEGITVEVRSGRLAVMPKGALTPDLREELRQHKPELVAQLAKRDDPTADEDPPPAETGSPTRRRRTRKPPTPVPAAAEVAEPEQPGGPRCPCGAVMVSIDDVGWKWRCPADGRVGEMPSHKPPERDLSERPTCPQHPAFSLLLIQDDGDYGTLAFCGADGGHYTRLDAVKPWPGAASNFGGHSQPKAADPAWVHSIEAHPGRQAPYTDRIVGAHVSQQQLDAMSREGA